MSIHRLLEIGAAPAPDCGDALRRMGDGELTGIVVRGVYPPEAMATVARRLEGAEVESARPYEEATEYHVGRLLQWAGPERADYHSAARRFDQICERLFAGLVAYRQVVESVLGRFSGGRPVLIATSSEGEPYSRSTIRLMHEGEFLPLHFDKQQLPFPGYDDLRPRIDLTTLLSFFIPIALPLEGGELLVYSRRWTPADNDFEKVNQSGLAAEAKSLPREVFRPEVGDMLMWNAGGVLHEVTPVRGARPRYTIGGFVAFAKDGASLRYWA